ncbi:MAG: excinuclease ABC subunit UvrC [Eubacteriales bacterium]|nr:excinuclease ABC subunit UvrC [Eubacteriales bacterium]
MTDIDNKLKNLPMKPGVYIMHAADGDVIYVGKAKLLKNRVSQYFQSGKSHSAKVRAMVENIADLEYIVTDTELEALILECNLIKKYMPKYNILLKDSKGYPYIKVTVNEAFPRVQLARSISRDGAKYFGPYVSTLYVRNTIELIKSLFPVRSCNRKLPEDIGKGRVCLNYHIHRCTAPCQGYVTQEEYMESIENILDFLNGKTSNLIKTLNERMKRASENLEFEQAAKLRDRIAVVKKIGDEQKIISSKLNNKDVFAIDRNGNDLCLQMFIVREGKITGRESYMLSDNLEMSDEEILCDFIKQFYSVSRLIPKTIVVNKAFEDIEIVSQWLTEKSGYKTQIICPKRGENRDLINMLHKNIIETLRLEELKRDKKNRKMSDMLFELKNLTGISKIPVRIESFDISHTGGKDNVGVCVVFENAIPKKKDYKKFIIRSVDGADDYESMREVVYRRIFNGIEGEKGFTPLPDLILLDGGKGQVSAVKSILEALNCDIPVFGMVKDNKHRTRALTTDKDEVTVSRTSSVFTFLTILQDEVHRFAIDYHRKKRSKSVFKSELDDIRGVGPTTKKKLLKAFGSIEAIKQATSQELISAGLNKDVAYSVYYYFSGKDGE